MQKLVFKYCCFSDEETWDSKTEAPPPARSATSQLYLRGKREEDRERESKGTLSSVILDWMTEDKVGVIITDFKQGMQKSISKAQHIETWSWNSYNNNRPLRVPCLSAKKRKFRLQVSWFYQIETKHCKAGKVLVFAETFGSAWINPPFYQWFRWWCCKGVGDIFFDTLGILGGVCHRLDASYFPWLCSSLCHQCTQLLWQVNVKHHQSILKWISWAK